MNKDIILIFGGDGKIAQAIVRKYLELNCVVIAVDKKEKNDNEEFTKNENYYYFSTDITSVDELTNLYNKLHNKFGYVNHIISAAGEPAPSEKSIDDIIFDDIDKSVVLNLISHIYITKIFINLLRNTSNKNKSFVFISSINALKSIDLPAYSSSKSGILGLMHCLCRPLGKENIRINTISPGTVANEKEIKQSEKFWGYSYKKMLALENFTSPADIADALYGLTHITKAITGQNIVVDSGQII